MLLCEIHRVLLMAVAALLGVVGFHLCPDTLGHGQAVCFKLLLGVDLTGELGVDLFGCFDLAEDLWISFLGYMAI